jgi:hypothetical protein
MRTTPLLAAATLALALAPAAWAQRYPDYRPDYRPGYGQTDRIESLARQVEDTAAYIHHTAERNNRRPDRYESQMLAQLHELNDAARHFRHEVEGYRQDTRHTRDDFRDLVGVYRDTWNVLDNTGRRDYIDRGMQRIGYLLDELSRSYGVRGSYGHQWGRRGRYNDRYDRDNRRGDSRYGDDDRYDDGRPR